MRHRVDHRRLGMKTEHRLAVLRNLLTALILHERIKTTVARAKELQRFAEKVITLGKSSSLHARRRALRHLRSHEALNKLFGELAERFRNRNGGYTRLYRLNFRGGDGAELSIIELVDRARIEKKPEPAKKETVSPEAEKKVAPEKPKKEEKKRRWFWWRKEEEKKRRWFWWRKKEE